MAYATVNTHNTSTSGAFVSAFSAAFQAASKEAEKEQSKGKTWNGDTNFASLGGDLKAAFVALDQKAVRNVEPATLASLLETVISRIEGEPTPAAKADGWKILFLYLFHLRKIRGVGKGERDLFYQIFLEMADKFPKTAILLVPLVWKFGYWKDLTNMVGKAKAKSLDPFVDAILDEFVAQIDHDFRLITGKDFRSTQLADLKAIKEQWTSMDTDARIAAVKAFDDTLTLVGKYMPAEKHKADKSSGITKMLVLKMFFKDNSADITHRLSSPDGVVKTKAIAQVKYCLMRYRNIKTILNTVLDTPEVKMCDGRWSELYIEGIASKAMLRYRKALLNEKLKLKLSEGDMDTGNRHPYNQDRIDCRAHMMSAMRDQKLKGGVLQISEIGRQIMKAFKQCGHSYSGNQSITKWEVNTAILTVTDREVLCIQWMKAREAVEKILADAKAQAIEDGVDPAQLQMFEDVLAVIDVSGSMFSADVAAEAVSLGLLCSELTSHNFVLPFSENPTPVDLSGATDIVDKFRMVLNTPWGYSTNADKVNRCVLDIAERARAQHKAQTGNTIPVHKFLPGAVCYFTDGQFNGGYGGGMCPDLDNPTMLQRAQKMVSKRAPGGSFWRSIFWNLNGNSPGFPAMAKDCGVQLVSGFSQSLFRQILVGDFQTVVDPVTGKVTVKVDPWETFMKAVNDPELLPVLEVLSASQEGVLAHYTFAPGADE